MLKCGRPTFLTVWGKNSIIHCVADPKVKEVISAAPAATRSTITLDRL